MFNIDKTKNLKIITVDKKIKTSIKRIVYLPTSKKDHERVKHFLDVIGVAFPSLVPREVIAGQYLNGKLYQDVIVENPKTEEDFLKSKSFAIPLTDNPVITQLYYSFYKGGESSLKEISPLFDRLLNSKEVRRITPLMLIAFLEANLNAENSKKPDLESHAYFILYKYIEHLFIFEQFMTCEQKFLETIQGGHRLSTLEGSSSDNFLGHIDRQIWHGIIPFISKVFIRKQQLPFRLPFVNKQQLPFKLPFVNKMYIENNSLDIRLDGKNWRIINDIDLLIKSLNFLADKAMFKLDDGEWVRYNEEDGYNIFCELRGPRREQIIKKLDRILIETIKEGLDINR